MNKKMNFKENDLIPKIKFSYALKNLFKYLSPYIWSFIGAILMVIFTVIAMTAAPSIEGMITTQLMKDSKNILSGVSGAGVNFQYIFHVILVLLFVYFIKTVSQGVGINLLTNSIQHSMYDLRCDVQRKISKLPVRYFDGNSYGDILSRITNDIDTISNSLQQTLTQIVTGFLTVIFSIVMMFSINYKLALIALLIIPYSLFVSSAVIKKSQSKFINQQNSLGKLNGLITEMYTGYNEILLYNKQVDVIDDFKKTNNDLQKHAFKAQLLSSLMHPLISLGTYIVIGSIGVVGSIFAIQGVIAIGQLQAFIRYIWQINDPVSQVSQLSAQIQTAFAAMQRVFEIIDEEEEVIEKDNPDVIENIEGNVVFENVEFGYTDKTIIHNLNISVKPGQMVAIVGPTGAGKTTIINLLLRFYDVNKGRILIDGVDIRNMKRKDLRSLFGMVLQDTWLFSGSIYDNIRYGRLDARKDEIVDAAKTANVHHFIKTLSHGYDTIINEEGNNISQGEKQLITIARAILKDPKILILDEATSSVDTRIEKILQEAMHKVMENRTSFVIAHRLSTIRNADVILVMKDGEIIEIGNHDELMKSDSYYKQLYNSQFVECK